MIILIIEDQDKRFFTIINRFKILLKKNNLDYIVETISDWRKAIDYFIKNQENIKIIILDVRMPKEDEDGYSIEDKNTGIEIYRKIKEIDQNKDIIFWTILTKAELEEEGINISDDDYIKKSSDFENFFAKIDTKLGTNLSKEFEDTIFP